MPRFGARLCAALILTLLVTACAPPSSTAPTTAPPATLESTPAATSEPPTRSPSPVAVATPSPSPTVGVNRQVFVIVMENTSLSQALRGKYIGTLAEQYGLATNYHAVGSPSLPNYLALTAGDTFGIEDDDYHSLPKGGIGDQLTTAGISWRAYMEGMGGDCRVATDLYAVKHNPFAYYGGGCPTNVVPFNDLHADLTANTPRLMWVTPDVCHDGHDCGLNTADTWLSEMVPLITASPAWQADGVLFIVWDEGSGGRGGDVVPLLVIAPGMAQHTTAKSYDHYSLLATIEKLLGVPALGRAAQADPVSDLVPRL